MVGGPQRARNVNGSLLRRVTRQRGSGKACHHTATGMRRGAPSAAREAAKHRASGQGLEAGIGTNASNILPFVINEEAVTAFAPLHHWPVLQSGCFPRVKCERVRFCTIMSLPGGTFNAHHML